ncbi:heme ABC exporter ATP-binding protein CcmA [Acetobacter sp. LMG 1627]|uniref:Heme ABC exporter ATP-binding protein CcmA n=1 Tax=Acetobacter conturbans TaxID=1737472 RepID=A0ABX0K201_9PROT|nr:heme ABC exporter ATP-binding protein CcmA [Acetobacter conturbans]NHN89663.1 heme ABC exporter ATP-binding protein CcmA [Acetobacter conturbans]
MLAQDISVFRGERLVLDTVGLSLSSGEALLLTGPNGAGKSTLLRVLAGLRKPDAGQLLWDGENAFADRTNHAHRIAYLGHQDALKPGLTLIENLTIFSHGAPLDEALDAFELRHLADAPVRLFSAGQKRRAALARIMLAQAPLWLLDEPSLGLDVHSVERLGDVLRRHREDGGMIIATTHVPLPLDNVRHLALPGAPVEEEPVDEWADEGAWA